MLRIINKQTGVFLRDDFTFDKNTEIGINVNPSQGFYSPKWNGEQWIEGLTKAEILAIKNQSNSDIANIRQQAYRDRSDSLYIAWQKYVETHDERAEEAKQSWLDEINRIDVEFPYL